MSPTPRTGPGEREAGRPASPRGGPVLAVIAAAQLVVVSNGARFGISTGLGPPQDYFETPTSLVTEFMNSYALAFGGLLLLGGRLADLFGHRRVLRAGLVVLSLTSLLSMLLIFIPVPLAAGDALFFSTRFLLGAGAALVAPAALSSILVNFPEGRERNKAMGVYVAVSGIGLPLSVVLAEYLFLPWPMLLNAPVCLVALAGTKALAEDGRDTGGRLDVPGAVTGSVGLLALFYGITRDGEGDWIDFLAQSSEIVRDDEGGWIDSLDRVALAAAFVLLAVFLVIQGRSTHPITPPRLLADRNRAGADAALLLTGAGMFAISFFLALYLQHLHSDVYAGYGMTAIAYLPFSFGMGIGAVAGSRLVTRLAPRRIAGPGLAFAAAGAFWLSTLEQSPPYLTQVMPAMFCAAAGLGFSFVPLALVAVSRVRDQDRGAASALVNTAQQVGGVLGVLVLGTVSVAAVNNSYPGLWKRYEQALETGDERLFAEMDSAVAHGYATAFLMSGTLLVAALVIVVTTVNAPRRERPENDTAVSAG